jgi:mono/diheme cytochrome c family protein
MALSLVGWAKSHAMDSAWARRACDFAHAEKPKNAPLPTLRNARAAQRVALACATFFSIAAPAAVAEDFKGLVDIGRKM